jgi:hypothetical protein
MRAPMRRFRWLILAPVLVVIISGCAGVAYQPALLSTVAPATAAATPRANPAAQASPAPAQPSPTVAAETGATTADVSPTAEATPAPAEGSGPLASPSPADTETPGSTGMQGMDTPAAPATATAPAATGQGVLYQDDFTNPDSGWPDNLEFGNYNIGYHEPDHYHVDVHTPHDRALVAVPGRSFSDGTVEVQVQAEPNNTAKTGDFRYGLFFRRSGNEYYAFAVSPRTSTWYALKSSPTGLTELAKGSNDSIQGLTAPDALRVDVKGSTFFLHINDQIIGQVSDADYAGGEVGFYVETFDSPRVHAHYGTITVREAEAAPPAEQGVLYQDDFTKPDSGWPDNLEFGNYNIGYHEPNHYHVDVHTPRDRALVAVPRRSFSDGTIEVQVQAEPNNTAKTGDFRYGLFFRRSGNEYYAFAVSPRTSTWYALKSSPTGLTELAKGSNDSIQGLTAPDALRVDVKGSTIFFHINDQTVGQVRDADYAGGEVGFYVETFDSPRVHAHYGTITVREAEAPQLQCTVTTPALRLRLGPGTEYPIITYLYDGVRLVPVARSANGLWVEVRMEGSDQTGWIANSPELVTCSLPVDSLPLPAQ